MNVGWWEETVGAGREVVLSTAEGSYKRGTYMYVQTLHVYMCCTAHKICEYIYAVLVIVFVYSTARLLTRRSFKSLSRTQREHFKKWAE